MRRSGAGLVWEGYRWITGHPDEWIELQRLCLQLHRRWRRITCAGIYAMAEVEGITIANDATVKRDKSLWSTLSRYLLKYHPELEGNIETRDCEVGREVEAHGLPELADELIYKEAA